MKNDPKEAYRTLLLDPRWRIRRQQVLEAKGRRCEDCGSTERLEVHHGYYRRGRAPWDYPDSALHVLCSGCHGDQHREDELPPMVPVIRSIAAGMELAKPPRDWRPKLWEIAQARATSKADSTALMKVLSWLWFTRGIHDLSIMNRVASAITGMANPYAYLQPGGVALESLIGARAVERAEDEQEENRRQDNIHGLGRKDP